MAKDQVAIVADADKALHVQPHRAARRQLLEQGKSTSPAMMGAIRYTLADTSGISSGWNGPAKPSGLQMRRSMSAES